MKSASIAQIGQVVTFTSVDMSAKIHKDLRKLMKSYDFTLYRDGIHYSWHGPNGAVVVTSKTPGKARWLKEIEKNIRRQIA